MLLSQACEVLQTRSVFPLKTAWKYAELGFAVIPLYPYDFFDKDRAGKVPWIKGWQNKGIPTKEEIADWYASKPTSNIGAVMGYNSGLIGIDIDGELGEKLLQEKSNGDIPDTWEFLTPGGGRRLLYRIPEGVSVRKVKAKESKEDKERKGEHEELAFFGNGSQTVLPPSVHPKTKGVYKWVEEKTPKDIECAMAPNWLIEEMKEKKIEKPKKKEKPKKGKTNKENINTQNNPEQIINQLIGKCQQFSFDWKEQQESGLDEEAWFRWCCLFVAVDMPDVAEYFSQASRKHAGRSDSRLENLIQKQSKKGFPPIRCMTIGCDVEQITECHNNLHSNNDGEIINSPAIFLLDEGCYKYFENKIFRSKWLGDDIMKDFHFIHTAEQLYTYDSGVYMPGGEKLIRSEATERLEKEFTSRRISETIEYIKNKTIHNIEDLDQLPEILNLRNGLYDINSKVFKSHAHTYLSIVQLNAHYNELADCPLFFKFLNEILPQENVYLLQEIFGYCLTRYTEAQKAFLFYGPGQTGKSTVLGVLEHMLNKKNTTSIPLQNLSDRFKTAALFGKLANIVADIPARVVEDAGTFKAITGEDSITAERKFENEFSFKPFAKLLFSCNSLPASNDRTTGFYRRLIIIPFNHVITEEVKDGRLKERLYNEVDGILKWSLEGLERLIRNNFKFTENDSTRLLLENYKRNNSSVLSFINDNCEIKPESKVKRQLLYDEYKKYCVDNGFKTLSQKKFNDEIENSIKAVYKKQDGNSRDRIWSGIELIHEPIFA